MLVAGSDWCRSDDNGRMTADTALFLHLCTLYLRILASHIADKDMHSHQYKSIRRSNCISSLTFHLFIYDIIYLNSEKGVHMDIREFSKVNLDQNDKKSNQDTKNYEDIINQYKNLDQNSLMAELLRQASKLRQEGKLSAEKLENLEKTLSPMLNTEQRQILADIVEKLK